MPDPTRSLLIPFAGWRRSRREEKLVPRRLRLETLEDRVLMSVSPLDPGLALLPGVAHHVTALMIPPLGEGEGGTGGQGSANASESNLPPVFLGMPPIILSEDANPRWVDLRPFFQDPDGPTSSLTFQLLTVPGGRAFDQFELSGARLLIDPGADMFGEYQTSLRVTDELGEWLDLDVPISVLPMNDRPTTSGFSAITIAGSETSFVIDLWQSFADKEDPDSALTYTITKNSNPDLFRSAVIDPTTGKLTLTLIPGISGTSTITLRATDTQGASVEMSTEGTDFQVYDFIVGNSPDLDQQRLSNFNLVTDFALFEFVNGAYDYTDFSETKFQAYLDSEFYDPNQPTIFDIENDYYTNTPEGRERFAEVLRYFELHQPNATQYGIYSFLPERNWWESVNWFRSQEDASRGLDTWFTMQEETLFAQHQAWLQSNALYRTAELADGSVLADYVTWVTPSLYTFYGSDFLEAGAPLVFDIDTNGVTNTFQIDSTTVVNGQSVIFDRSFRPLPGGISPYDEYYVVNSTGHSFQVSLTPGGTPVDIANQSQGLNFLRINGPRDHSEHDPDYVYWRAYAMANIAEGRKFNSEVVPWLSPTYQGNGINFMDKNFFRMQLDTTFELADGLSIWQPLNVNPADPAAHGWQEAVNEFMDYIHTPTQFTITVLVDEITELSGGYIRRVDRFTGGGGGGTPAFAAATVRLDYDADGNLRNGPDSGGTTGNIQLLGAVASSQDSSVPRIAPRAPLGGRPGPGSITALEAMDRLALRNARETRVQPKAPLAFRAFASSPDRLEEDNLDTVWSRMDVWKENLGRTAEDIKSGS